MDGLQFKEGDVVRITYTRMNGPVNFDGMIYFDYQYQGPCLLIIDALSMFTGIPIDIESVTGYHKFTDDDRERVRKMSTGLRYLKTLYPF